MSTDHLIAPAAAPLLATSGSSNGGNYTRTITALGGNDRCGSCGGPINPITGECLCSD